MVQPELSCLSVVLGRRHTAVLRRPYQERWQLCAWCMHGATCLPAALPPAGEGDGLGLGLGLPEGEGEGEGNGDVGWGEGVGEGEGDACNSCLSIPSPTPATQTEGTHISRRLEMNPSVSLGSCQLALAAEWVLCKRHVCTECAPRW